MLGPHLPKHTQITLDGTPTMMILLTLEVTNAPGTMLTQSSAVLSTQKTSWLLMLALLVEEAMTLAALMERVSTPEATDVTGTPRTNTTVVSLTPMTLRPRINAALAMVATGSLAAMTEKELTVPATDATGTRKTKETIAMAIGTPTNSKLLRNAAGAVEEIGGE